MSGHDVCMSLLYTSIATDFDVQISYQSDKLPSSLIYFDATVHASTQDALLHFRLI